MAHPEPIPILRGRQVEEYLERFRNFRLTARQKEFYSDAREFYRKLKPRE